MLRYGGLFASPASATTSPAGHQWLGPSKNPSECRAPPLSIPSRVGLIVSAEVALRHDLSNVIYKAIKGSGSSPREC